MGGVHMIDNERYKVDDLWSGRPIRKKMHGRFFVVADFLVAQRGKAQVGSGWQVIQNRGTRSRLPSPASTSTRISSFASDHPKTWAKSRFIP